MDTVPPIIVWFRQDLRIADHPALSAAASAGPIIPLFILDNESEDPWKLGGASKWWLFRSLKALDVDLRSLGSRLILRCGSPKATLDILLRETGGSAVYLTRRYEPHHRAEEMAISNYFGNKGISVRRFSGSLLFEPEVVQTKKSGPFRVFTPFYKACLANDIVQDPMPAPNTLQTPSSWPDSDQLVEWGFQPTLPNWARGLRNQWQPGSGNADNRLKHFLEQSIVNYSGDRDRPELDGTSSLSPHIHFGEISPRQIWSRTQQFTTTQSSSTDGHRAFLRELIWREFAYHLLHHWPHIANTPFHESFDNFQWREDAKALTCWQRGLTGYPIVDAGMRQLWGTGWMHNRVRMIVASFLTKHLLVDWREGARWFWDTLVDADLANNSASWQWVAGCGADASPYFRIFNPVLQGEKFDPDGVYVRKWVPELTKLPKRFIHTPWECPIKPANYPPPIIDHKVARRRSLDRYEALKNHVREHH